MTIEWAMRQHNVNIQRWCQYFFLFICRIFPVLLVQPYYMVNKDEYIGSRWQGRQGAWLIDTPPRMISLWLTPAVQSDCNHTTVAIFFRVRTPSKTRGHRLLHTSSTRVTLGIAAKDVEMRQYSRLLEMLAVCFVFASCRTFYGYSCNCNNLVRNVPYLPITFI